MIEERMIKSLKPHPINERIYGGLFDHELLSSIKEYGFKGTIEITKDDVIVSGHRRFNACVNLGYETIPVTVLEIEDENDIVEYLIRMNQSQRLRTTEQIAREFEVLKEVEEKRAKARQVDNLKQNQTDAVRENFPTRVTPEKEDGRARDIAAKKTNSGMSGKSLETSLKITKFADDIKEKHPEKSTEIIEKLNNKSINAAKSLMNEVKQEIEHEIKKEESEKAMADVLANDETQKQVSNPKFNATNDNIEWAKWSWNPVTGCKHGCSYCYAKDIAMRFNGNFDPEFHESRLGAPEFTKIPESRINEPGIKNVFVCSMADLFGEWVPSEWIEEVISQCEKFKQWTYLFLTKNPKRYLEFTFPSNCWIGASATNQKQFDDAIAALTEFIDAGNDGHVKFLSCEPLNNRINPYNNDMQFDNGYDDNNAMAGVIDWLIIGGRSKSTNMPAFQPDWGWVQDLIVAADNADIPIYFKPNLTVRPTYYPESK